MLWQIRSVDVLTHFVWPFCLPFILCSHFACPHKIKWTEAKPDSPPVNKNKLISFTVLLLWSLVEGKRQKAPWRPGCQSITWLAQEDISTPTTTLNFGLWEDSHIGKLLRERRNKTGGPNLNAIHFALIQCHFNHRLPWARWILLT